MSGDVKLEPCPFCGGPADIEEIAPKDAGGRNVSFSAGCRNMDGPDECIGQQSLLTFARKSDAAKAWNRRSSSAAERGMREALEELHALVWGECPSLLNEDSGGNAELDLRIRALSARAGEDEQATRGEDAATASISTDTKDTSK